MKQIEVVTVPMLNKCGEQQPVLMQVEWKGGESKCASGAGGATLMCLLTPAKI